MWIKYHDDWTYELKCIKSSRKISNWIITWLTTPKEIKHLNYTHPRKKHTNTRKKEHPINKVIIWWFLFRISKIEFNKLVLFIILCRLHFLILFWHCISLSSFNCLFPTLLSYFAFSFFLIMCVYFSTAK